MQIDLNSNIRMKTFKTQQSCFSQKSRDNQNQGQRNTHLDQQQESSKGYNLKSKRSFATLDEQFQHFYKKITKHSYFAQLTKHSKIRINKWLTKLSNISINQVWKKNRNNYIKLIKLMLDCEVIIAPINCIPPERDLHKLTNHQMNVIIDQVEKIVQQRDHTNRYECDGNQKHAVTCLNDSFYVDHEKNDYEPNKTHFKSQSKSKDRHMKSAQKSLLKIPKYPSIQNNNHLKNKQNFQIKEEDSKMCQSQQKAMTNQSSQIKKSMISSQYFSRKARTFTYDERYDRSKIQSFQSTERQQFMRDKQNNSSEFNQTEIGQILMKGMRFLSKFQQIRQQKEFSLLKKMLALNQINHEVQTVQGILQIVPIKQIQIQPKLKDIKNSDNIIAPKTINIVQDYSLMKKKGGQQMQFLTINDQKVIKKKQKLSLMTRAGKDKLNSNISEFSATKIIV